ncbi:ral guanine nucleotide dissociation stimulator-like 1 [Heteronotia binoei]|uniref:ral guanine nucleotide dissociation stimulator-like 1 n=1 Tax=Heteronotia binoei TaxID=13085 RepID=UPI00292F3B28|nr:ral guanine nucleotide dissociation stimulator-like 1 [Heteronotia binoei]
MWSSLMCPEHLKSPDRSEKSPGGSCIAEELKEELQMLVSIEDYGEEVEEGAVYKVTLKTVHIKQGAHKGARCLEVEEDKQPPEHILCTDGMFKIRKIIAGTLDKLMEALITPSTTNDVNYVNVFLSTYRGFASTADVLNLLLDRYENMEASAEDKSEVEKAITSVLTAWLERYPDDFLEPPANVSLRKLLDFLALNMPDSSVEKKAMQLLEQAEREPVSDKPSIIAADELALEEEAGGSEEFSAFPEDLIAEQLTLIDAELFKRVIPHNCLGCVWSNRDKKEHQHLASTIRATINQFNAVTNCVTATILNNKAVKTKAQRARIIEKWINIALECRLLKNFSSLKAIISALQSTSVYRLKKTWEKVSKAITSVLTAWLERYPDDFLEPPANVSLRKLLDFLALNMPDSSVEKKAMQLLEQAEREPVSDSKCSVPTVSFSPELALEEEAGGSEEFSAFPEDLIAEQLTLIDAELFKRVIPHNCLGCVWSNRDKKEHQHLASTIRATINQFNAVTNCVTATILNNKAVKTKAQRARIIEKWINVALECRLLKNFSSLKAIISALQSTSVYRLKKTWEKVSKRSMALYEELAGIFSDEDNHMTSRLLLMKEATSKYATADKKESRRRSRKRRQKFKDMGVIQGTVPYLGTFLTDLTMLDTALQDYTEGGLINFEKRRREFEILATIKLLQCSCNGTWVCPDPRFISWFKGLEKLTEKESYALSCEAETPASRRNQPAKPLRRLSP